jgi:hypothetical protein
MTDCLAGENRSAAKQVSGMDSNREGAWSQRNDSIIMKSDWVDRPKANDLRHTDEIKLRYFEIMIVCPQKIKRDNFESEMWGFFHGAILIVSF